MSENPYKVFRTWLCDGNMNSELDETVVKSIYIVSSLAMFSRFKNFTIYLNELLNNQNIYAKELQPKKLELFLELKEYCTTNRLSPWDLSFINLKKEKFEYKEIRDKFPLLKTYEIDLLIQIMKKEKNQSFLQILNDGKNKKKALPKTLAKIVNSK